jgi:DUF1365 family protein
MGKINTPQILFGRVMHARFLPNKNAFNYGIYYISIPLSQIQNSPISYNKFGLLSFFDKDHGACDGSNPDAWARQILTDYNIQNVSDITLMCMPRVMGYVFNPVSFWICRDNDKNIRAIICEVRNTFGERHTYLCAHPDHHPIKDQDVLKGDKLFHVSPFLEREGHYEFQFHITADDLKIDINFFNADGERQLLTYLKGDLKTMTSLSLRKAFWKYPLVTFKAIILIHWQALKIISKGINYISKPDQKTESLSTTTNLTKM